MSPLGLSEMRGFTCAMVAAAVGLICSVRAQSLSVPAYNSLPGAAAKFYLDFDGDVMPTWTVGYPSPITTYSPGTTPAYDIDGDATSYSSTELDRIHEIWMRVAEIYSPFNINVTTVDPLVYNNQESERIVIGGNGAWTGVVAGGISSYDAFVDPDPNTSFVFSLNLQ